MINITYDRKTNTTKVLLGNTSLISEEGKLKVVFKNIITNEIHYEPILGVNTWCTWCGAELITDVLFYNNKNQLVYEHKWDIIRDGDEIEKSLWLYLKNRQNNNLSSNGLVIGTHDGRNGHWIYSIKHGLSKATLIDGSDEQYINLVKNYQNNPFVETKNLIVTTDGLDVEWYQGGEGYTDTVVKELIESWVDSNEITKTSRSSVAINKIMSEKEYDWIHLDVEGIDGDLILSLEQRPNVIIYESMNLPQEMTDKLKNWFKFNGYVTITDNGNTIAKKVK